MSKSSCLSVFQHFFLSNCNLEERAQCVMEKEGVLGVTVCSGSS